MAGDSKVAIVTGAARPWGLGRATALALAQAGMDIVVADVRDDWGAEAVDAVKKTGRNAIYVRTDVSKKAQVQAMVDQTERELGRIDTLVNVAALVANERIDEMREETMDRLISVNLKGTMFTCQAVVPAMRKVGGGRIVNVASGGAVQPLKGSGIYGATKAGVVIFSKILAWEVGRDNIIVTTVAPGGMVTNMGQDEGPRPEEYNIQYRSPFNRRLKAEDVAEVIVFAATAASPSLTGQTLHANNGAYMV